jgi:flagellar basal body rod protein FlgG
MNYGLYLSAGGALASMHRQDVAANNLANLNTVGFKPDVVTMMSRLPERLEGGALSILGEGGPADPQWMLEQLGGGQFIAPSRVDLRPGSLQQTGNPLDLAIEGDGFFVVNASRNGAGAEGLRLTRDGRFTLNADGELVMSATGHRVMDANDQPITLDRDVPVTIDGQGNIIQDNNIVATLGFATIRDRAALKKEGDNLLTFVNGNGAQVQRQAASGSIHQRHIESSAVDPILALNSLINASKAAQANVTMMQYHDTILGQAINTFGRVA